MLLSDGSQEFGKNLRMFCRHIMVFVDIGSQIIEPRFAFYYHQFPVALSHANLVGFVKFPVQVIVMFLLCILAQKGRSDRDSVETITSSLSEPGNRSGLSQDQDSAALSNFSPVMCS